MADLRIHLPGALDPKKAGSNLSKTLRKKVSEGITRKVGRNINGLRQLDVTRLNAELKLGTDLKLGTEFREIKFREIKWMNLNTDLRLGTDLKLGTEFREIRFREIGFREVRWMNFGDLNLNCELNFDW